MKDITEGDLCKLREAEKAIREHHNYLAEANQPLTLTPHNRDGSTYQTVATGVLWIPGPFKNDFWTKARKKPKLNKCTCHCGHKHTKKGD